MQSCGLAFAAVAAIERVGGLDFRRHGSARRFSAPRLTTVAGDIDVVDNRSLARVELPALRTVGGDVDVSGNRNLCGDVFDDIVDDLVDFDGRYRQFGDGGCR